MRTWSGAQHARLQTETPDPGGLTDNLAVSVLVKVGSLGRGVEGRGSDRGANGLPKLYKDRLVPPDSRFHGTTIG